jgi:hypothetical protein
MELAWEPFHTELQSKGFDGRRRLYPAPEG